MNREELIEYIKKNERKFKYDTFNFNVLSKEELLTLKKIIDMENEYYKKKEKRNDKTIG